MGRLGLELESEPHVVGRLGSGPRVRAGGTSGGILGSGVILRGSCLQGVISSNLVAKGGNVLHSRVPPSVQPSTVRISEHNTVHNIR